jgi:hypothetical protein
MVEPIGLKCSRQETLTPPTPQCLSSGAPAPFRSALLHSLGLAKGPNFKFAASFLAKICGYIESSRIPFKHVDIWVLSSSDGYPNLDPTGATAPEPTVALMLCMARENLLTRLVLFILLNPSSPHFTSSHILPHSLQSLK